MQSDKLLLIMANYESRLKYLPTGVKQFLISQLLLDPVSVININELCKINYFIDQLVCQNIELYKKLWQTFISAKLPKKIKNVNDIKSKYLEAAKIYTLNFEQILIDENKKYEILFENALKIKKLFYDINESYHHYTRPLNYEGIIYYDIKNYFGDTPLMASIMKKPESVETLLKNGSNPNFLFYDSSPLTYAILSKNIDIVKLLIQYGADLNLKNKSGLTPFSYLIKIIQSHYPKPEFYEIALILLENGSNINTQDNQGNTVIFGVRDKKLLQFLIDNNINLNIRNNKGNNALDEMLLEYNYTGKDENIELLSFYLNKQNQ